MPARYARLKAAQPKARHQIQLQASILMNLALRGHSFRSSRQIGPASRFLLKSFCRLRSVDHRLALPSYQLVIVASTLDRSVMQYISG
jgi:hypothetical protein